MSKHLPANFPKSAAEWEAIIASAPGEETPEAAARLKDGVLVRSGGPIAVREALARKRGQRGPGKKPTKVSTTLRLPPDTLARWKASGPGWQTRMAEVLSKRAP